jgi:hypothetical protein
MLVAPIDKLSVVLVALFAFVFLGERPSSSGLARHQLDCDRRSDHRRQSLRQGSNHVRIGAEAVQKRRRADEVIE